MKLLYGTMLSSLLLLGLVGCSSMDKVAVGGVIPEEDYSQVQDNDNASGNDNTKDELKIEVKSNSAKVSLDAISKELALQMVEGKFDETYDKFTLSVKLKMTKKMLEDAWNKTVDGLGKYEDVYEITQEKVNQSQKVNVILQYENNGLKISFTYNKKQQLEGLWLTYSSIQEEIISTENFTEVEITFGGGKYPITGILTLPKDITNPPLVILVPGSGNHDVNEVVGANKPFRDIAWGLAEEGIASIRYNERALLYPELLQQDFTIEVDCLQDASDAIVYAFSSQKIDNSKIYVVGHSLGAMMAPKIATDHREVAGIVLLAGSPRKLEDIVLDQVKDSLANTKDITKAQTKEAMAITMDGVAKIKALQEGGSKLILGYPASYWYSLNQSNIAELTKELDIPIYIAQGSKDFQVYADKDYIAWQELLGDTDKVTYRLYDNLNHLFMKTNGKSDVTEYNTPDQVDQQVIKDIADWIKNN